MHGTFLTGTVLPGQSVEADCLAWGTSPPLALFSMKVWTIKNRWKSRTDDKPECQVRLYEEENTVKDVTGQNHWRQHIRVCNNVHIQEEDGCESWTWSDLIWQHEQARMAAQKSYEDSQEPIKWLKCMEETKQWNRTTYRFSLYCIFRKYWTHHWSIFMFPSGFYSVMTISMQQPVLSLLSFQESITSYLRVASICP